MKRELVHIDLFSGTGGFPLGLKMAGLQVDHHYYSEIEKHAINNYRYNFPEANYVGDVRAFSGATIRKRHPNAFIIVTFGWPCQDNSIAGNRKGQKHRAKSDLYMESAAGTAGEERRGSRTESLGAETEESRSGLLFEAVRVVLGSVADLFVAENVKGILSVNSGIDIIESLVILAGLHQDRPQYELEMQLHNTLWDLPQNRERTYFIGRARKPSARSILPVRCPDQIHGRKEGEAIRYSGTLTCKNQSPDYNIDSSTVMVGMVNYNGKIHTREQANTIDKNYHKGVDNHGQRSLVLVGKTVRTEESKVIRKKNQRSGIDSNPFGAKELEFRDQSFMNTLINTPGADNLIGEPIKMITHSRDESGKIARYKLSDNAGAIHQSSGMGGNTDQFVMVRGVGENSGQTDIMAIVDSNGRIKPKLKNTGAITGNYRAGSNTADMDLLQLSDLRIRRLTEVECERLQGYPDNWTRVGVKENGKTYFISSTPRYAMIGNAVSTVTVKAIAEVLKPEILAEL